MRIEVLTLRRQHSAPRMPIARIKPDPLPSGPAIIAWLA